MADSAIDKLQNKPKDQRVAIAEGAAVSVVIILLVAWGIYFFHKIQSGTQEVSLDSGTQDAFNFSNVKEAQEQLKSAYSTVKQDISDLQDQGGGSNVMEIQTIPAGGGSDGNIFSDGMNE